MGIRGDILKSNFPSSFRELQQKIQEYEKRMQEALENKLNLMKENSQDQMDIEKGSLAGKNVEKIAKVKNYVIIVIINGIYGKIFCLLETQRIIMKKSGKQKRKKEKNKNRCRKNGEVYSFKRNLDAMELGRIEEIDYDELKRIRRRQRFASSRARKKLDIFNLKTSFKRSNSTASILINHLIIKIILSYANKACSKELKTDIKIFIIKARWIQKRQN